MAGIPITDLPEITSTTSADVIPIVQSGVTNQVQLANITGLTQYATGSASTGAALIGYLQAGTGATSRTAQNKMRDFVSVKDFGAVGNGSTDDTSAIQAAIDAMIANDGGTVFFPSGIYQITSTLNITSSCVSLLGVTPGWFGNTGGATIRMGTANTGILHIYGASAAAQINSNCVTNLLFVYGTNSGNDTNTAGYGIFVENTVRTTIDNCVVIGMNMGLRLKYAVNAFFTRMRINRLFDVPAGTAYGIYLEDDGSHWNASNTFRDFIIAGPTTRTGTFKGVYYAGAGLNDQFFENVEVSICDYGFDFELTAPTVDYDIKITKCVVDNYASRGIYLSGFTSGGGVDIIGGWLAPSSTASGAVYGIYGLNSVGIKVLGIEMVGLSNIANTSAIGIYLNTCSDCQIVGNRIRDYYYQVAGDTLTNTTITGNSFKSTSGSPAAFVLLNTSSAYNTISGNVFNAATSITRGIFFQSGTNNQEFGNIFVGTYSTAKVANVSVATSISNALNSNLAISPNIDYIELTGGGASAQIGGIVAGYEGQQLVITNTTGSAVDILAENASSTAANRIYTPGLGTVTVTNLGSRSFRYSGSLSRWLMVGSVAT